MSVPLAALQLRQSPFDPVGTLQVAANLGQAQANSELAKLRMAELQEEAAENRERRGALGRYRTDGGITSPPALTHLAGYPDLFATAQAASTTHQTQAREANARAAQRVASIPEGPERAVAWQEELEYARREGRMTPEQYQRYAAIPMPPSTFLQGIIQQGRALPTAAELQRQRIYDEMFGLATPSSAPPTSAAPPGAPRVTVNSEAAPQFAGLLSDLEASGVRIDPAQTGGYNPRNIAGTNTPSLHASGRAVDVNWRANPEGRPLPDTRNPANQLPYDMYGEGARRPTETIHPDIARDAARRNGLRWGGDFQGRSPDPMHFEVAANGPAPPVAQRGLTTVAGLTPPAPATAPATPPAANPAAQAQQMGIRERIASFTREQQDQIRLLMAENKTEDALKLIREFSGDTKPPPGFERDPANAARLRPIGGGPAEQITDQAAARMSFLDTAMQRMPMVRTVFERAWSKGDVFRNMAAGGADTSGRRDFPAISGEVGLARSAVRMMVEGALRAQTGAAAPESEVDTYTAMFMPGATDSIESAREKLNRLQEFTERFRAMALAGRSTAGVLPTTVPPNQTPPATPPAAGGYRVLGVR